MRITHYRETATMNRPYNLLEYSFGSETYTCISGKHFVADSALSRFYAWSEKNGFRFYDAKDNTLWTITERIAYALALPHDEHIWLVRRDNYEAATVWLYDYQGKCLAEQHIEDEVYASIITLKPLPDEAGVVIAFAGGQDGSQSHFLQYQDESIHIIKTLPADIDYEGSIANNRQAILFNYYEQQLHIANYPTLKIRKTFQFPDEYYCRHIQLLTDKRLLISDGSMGRHFLFDIDALQIREEIILQGYEPAVDEDGFLISPIAEIDYEDGRFIFHYCDYQQGKIIKKYLISEPVEL